VGGICVFNRRPGFRGFRLKSHVGGIYVFNRRHGFGGLWLKNQNTEFTFPTEAPLHRPLVENQDTNGTLIRHTLIQINKQ